jgi:beta-glucosidase
MLRWVARLALVGILSTCVAGSAMAADQPWRDASQPPGQRADELLAAMTPDQKVSMALGDLGSLAALGVPTLPSDDGPSGIRADGTTSLPSAQTLAATFDRSLARAYGEAVGTEARGKGFNWWLGPAMDIARTPLAGRQPENLGEDPFLAGETVAQEVAGAKSAHVIATLKHYVANNAEWGRIGFNTPTGRSGGVNALVSERALQEISQAPFKRAIRKSTADAVMCSYNRLNGPQTCESSALLSDLKASGFQGFVAPDFIFAVKDPLAATLAGLDVPALGGAGGRTAAMFTSGQVPPARLDDIVRRTLFAMFDSGVFDDSLGPAAPNVSTPEHQALATKVSAGGMVLLRNERHALPLGGRKLRSIAVIGPAGDDAVYVSGGSSAVTPAPGATVTPLAGIRARAGSGVNVTAAQGSLGDVPLTTIVPGDAPGFAATYWTNGDFSGTAALTRSDPTSTRRGAARRRPLWSARWTGTVTPTESGLYRFLAAAGRAGDAVGRRSAGRARLPRGCSVHRGPRYPMQAAVRLTAGKPVSIPVDTRVGAALRRAGPLAWQPPSASGIPAAVEARATPTAIVMANQAAGEGMDHVGLGLATRTSSSTPSPRSTAGRSSARHGRSGADAVAAPRRGRAPGLVSGPAVRRALASVRSATATRAGGCPSPFPAGDAQAGAPTRPERYPGVNGEQRYDEGIFVGYRWYDQFRQQPLFPFGYGLPRGLPLRRPRVRSDHGGVIGVDARDEHELCAPGRPSRRPTVLPRSAGEPPRQLKGYEKVQPAPGRRRGRLLPTRPRDPAYFDEGAHRQVVADGRYTLSVGSLSRDPPESASFELGGRGSAWSEAHAA